MYTHICVGAKDLDESQKFYDAALAPLGIDSAVKFSENGCIYGTDAGSF